MQDDQVARSVLALDAPSEWPSESLQSLREGEETPSRGLLHRLWGKTHEGRLLGRAMAWTVQILRFEASRLRSISQNRDARKRENASSYSRRNPQCAEVHVRASTGISQCQLARGQVQNKGGSGSRRSWRVCLAAGRHLPRQQPLPTMRKGWTGLTCAPQEALDRASIPSIRRQQWRCALLGLPQEQGSFRRVQEPCRPLGSIAVSCNSIAGSKWQFQAVA